MKSSMQSLPMKDTTIITISNRHLRKSKLSCDLTTNSEYYKLFHK